MDFLKAAFKDVKTQFVRQENKLNLKKEIMIRCSNQNYFYSFIMIEKIIGKFHNDGSF